MNHMCIMSNKCDASMMNSLMLIYAMIDDLLPCSCLYMIKAACVGPRCLITMFKTFKMFNLFKL